MEVKKDNQPAQKGDEEHTKERKNERYRRRTRNKKGHKPNVKI